MKRLKFVKEVCGEGGLKQVPGDVRDVNNDVVAQFLLNTGNAVETDDDIADGDDDESEE